MALPNMFAQREQNTTNRPQTPQLPNPVGGRMGGAQSQITGQQGQRPVFSQMSPDNGQHGGRRRYMNPESGAMMQTKLQQQNGTQGGTGMPHINFPSNTPGPTQPYPSNRATYGGSQFGSGVFSQSVPGNQMKDQNYIGPGYAPMPQPGFNVGGSPMPQPQPMPINGGSGVFNGSIYGSKVNTPFNHWASRGNPYAFMNPGGP